MRLELSLLDAAEAITPPWSPRQPSYSNPHCPLSIQRWDACSRSASLYWKASPCPSSGREDTSPPPAPLQLEGCCYLSRMSSISGSLIRLDVGLLGGDVLLLDAGLPLSLILHNSLNFASLSGDETFVLVLEVYPHHSHLSAIYCAWHFGDRINVIAPEMRRIKGLVLSSCPDVRLAKSESVSWTDLCRGP